MSKTQFPNVKLLVLFKQLRTKTYLIFFDFSIEATYLKEEVCFYVGSFNTMSTSQ